MIRSHRPLALFLIWVLTCASFVVTERPPVARAATTVLVTTSQDLTASNPSCASPCSLRQAIIAANNSPGSTVAFNIPDTDPGYSSQLNGLVRTWTITPTIPLPFISALGTIVNGTTQAANYGGNPNIFGPEIIVDGSLVTTAGGITTISDNNKILGLGIIKFQGTSLKGVGIEIRGNNNTIQGNYIGVNKTGDGPAGNNDAGIWLRGNGNTVGGDSTFSTGEFNVISGNTR